VILKVIKPTKRRIPLPKQSEQVFKERKRYTRKKKYKKDWGYLENEE